MSGVTTRSIMSVSTVKVGTTMKSMKPGEEDIRECECLFKHISIIKHYCLVFEVFHACLDKKKPGTLKHVQSLVYGC